MRLGVGAWGRGLTQPFYVPPELKPVRAMFAAGCFSEAMRELWRLASMGSNSAAATLGYICLVSGKISGIDCSAAEQLCLASANRNDAYAQYVIAWREYELGHYQELRNWLHRSANQRFAPAISDLGRLAVTASRQAQRRPKVAIRYFRIAFCHGHVLAILFFLRYCRKKTFGTFLQIFSILALPILSALLLPMSWFCPFSVAIFTYPASNKRPLFEQLN